MDLRRRESAVSRRLRAEGTLGLRGSRDLCRRERTEAKPCEASLAGGRTALAPACTARERTKVTSRPEHRKPNQHVETTLSRTRSSFSQRGNAERFGAT